MAPVRAASSALPAVAGARDVVRALARPTEARDVAHALELARRGPRCRPRPGLAFDQREDIPGRVLEPRLPSRRASRRIRARLPDASGVGLDRYHVVLLEGDPGLV